MYTRFPSIANLRGDVQSRNSHISSRHQLDSRLQQLRSLYHRCRCWPHKQVLLKYNRYRMRCKLGCYQPDNHFLVPKCHDHRRRCWPRKQLLLKCNHYRMRCKLRCQQQGNWFQLPPCHYHMCIGLVNTYYHFRSKNRCCNSSILRCCVFRMRCL